ncbi:hypothetical protein [Changchengzhania lutea]|uniref:hypothetical protein n=1 Tax=Changchengzhania lutea TaxID=2049305 RepID=UPI00115C67F6|nr:hypothetical protein [Changchengzhania lutea]
MKNIFKKGFYLIAVLCLGMVISCDDDDNEMDEIAGLDFVIATLNLEGTEIGVVPTTVNNNNTIVYTVDYGTAADDDVFQTSGPMVRYEFPNEDSTYNITVTAALPGNADVSITKEITITEYIPPAIPTGSGNPLEGAWKLAPEAGALGVGPGKDNVSWWSSAVEDVATRDCLFDDRYVFNEDGSFENVLGTETWLEGWQGTTPEACGAPVFPHDGTASATYTYNEAAGTITINGKGAFLGLAKVVNGAEIGSPSEAADSITYLAVIDGDTMELDIEIAGGGFWSFRLVKDVPSIVGTWKLAPEAGALGVGPGKDNVSWWSSAIEDVATRDCLFDDEYVFNADGTFENVLGTQTWLEGWQGTDPEACGTPVFPHDGTATATYTYNEAAGTITIDGKGAFLGLAKVINGAEIGSPSEAADSITYIAALDGNTLELDIEIAGGGFWSFRLVKQ